MIEGSGGGEGVKLCLHIMFSVPHYYYYSIFNLIKIAWNYWIRMSMICKIMEI